MQKHDKIFLIFLAFSSLLLAAIFTENIRSVLVPQATIIRTAALQHKDEIKESGTTLHTAQYWEALE